MEKGSQSVTVYHTELENSRKSPHKVEVRGQAMKRLQDTIQL